MNGLKVGGIAMSNELEDDGFIFSKNRTILLPRVNNPTSRSTLEVSQNFTFK